MAEDLPLAEIQKRLKAARALRGMRSVDLKKVMVEKHQLRADPISLAERGAKPLPGGYRRLIAEELELPRDWFTAPEEDLFAQGTGPPPSVEELMVRIEEVREVVAEMSSKLAGNVVQHIREIEAGAPNTSTP